MGLHLRSTISMLSRGDSPHPGQTQVKKKYNATAGGGEGHRILNDQPSRGYLIWSYDVPGLYRNNDGRTIWGGGLLGSDGLGNQNE
jgi:hypothetical protein